MSRWGTTGSEQALEGITEVLLSPPFLNLLPPFPSFSPPPQPCALQAAVHASDVSRQSASGPPPLLASLAYLTAEEPSDAHILRTRTYDLTIT